ncbi:hypothetical protein WG66_014742, partial [Moniliophthora roreri]
MISKGCLASCVLERPLNLLACKWGILNFCT